jgi:hypothetical protein
MASTGSNRAKLSTTIAQENFQYLESLVRSGEARNLAQALDMTLHRSRRLENRRRLERATAAYFDGLSPEAQAEEEELARAFSGAAAGIDFDRE